MSVLIDGYCDVYNCCLSVPCVIGRQGIHRRLETQLNERETQAFENCAHTIQQQIQFCQSQITQTY